MEHAIHAAYASAWFSMGKSLGPKQLAQMMPVRKVDPRAAVDAEIRKWEMAAKASAKHFALLQGGKAGA